MNHIDQQALASLIEEMNSLTARFADLTAKANMIITGSADNPFAKRSERVAKKKGTLEQRILTALSRSAEYVGAFSPLYRTYLERNAMTRTQIFRAIGNPAEIKRHHFDQAINGLLAAGTVSKLELEFKELQLKGRRPEMIVLTSQLHRFYEKDKSANVPPLPSGYVPAHVIAQFKENYGEPLARPPVATPPADNYGYPHDFVPPTGESIEVYAARMAEFRKNLQMADLSSPRDEY